MFKAQMKKEKIFLPTVLQQGLNGQKSLVTLDSAVELLGAKVTRASRLFRKEFSKIQIHRRKCFGQDYSCSFAFPVAQLVKNPPAMQKMQKMQVQSLGWEDPLEKEMEYWKPTPVFSPGKSHGQRSLEGHSPWGHNRVRHNRECTHMGACTQTHTQICSLGIVTLGLDLPMVFCHCLFCCCLKVWGFPGDASGKESA